MSLSTAICDWTIAKISNALEGFHQLINNCKALHNSVEPTAIGMTKFIAPQTLDLEALGLPIIRACYATRVNHERAMLKQLLRSLDLLDLLIKLGSCTPRAIFRHLQKQAADFLLMVDCNAQTFYRQITWKIEGTLQILFEETDQDLGNGRDITRSVCAKEAKRQVCQVSVCNGWNLERLHGTTRRKTIQCRRLFLTSMTITPITILQLVGELRIIEGWHWIRDT